MGKDEGWSLRELFYDFGLRTDVLNGLLTPIRVFYDCLNSEGNCCCLVYFMNSMTFNFDLVVKCEASPSCSR